MLTTSVPGLGSTSIQPVSVSTCESLLALLEQKGEEPAVLVGADALVAFGCLAARVANDLDQMIGGSAGNRVEDVLVLLERQRESAQQPSGQCIELGLPARAMSA